MKRTKLIIALALLLAAQTAAKADSRIAKLCGPDHVNEVASDNVNSTLASVLGLPSFQRHWTYPPGAAADQGQSNRCGARVKGMGYVANVYLAPRADL